MIRQEHATNRDELKTQNFSKISRNENKIYVGVL